MELREVRAGENICDFCSTPEPKRRFECPSFPMVPGYSSLGAWMACDTCGSLIDREEWDKLLLRAVDKIYPKYQSAMPRRIFIATIKQSHELFRAHYKKAATS
jgi:hypothetical protein